MGCDGIKLIYLEDSLMCMSQSPRMLNKLSQSGKNLVNVEESLLISLAGKAVGGVAWGWEPESGPGRPLGLPQQAVFARETLFSSVGPTRLPKERGARLLGTH